MDWLLSSIQLFGYLDISAKAIFSGGGVRKKSHWFIIE